MSMMIAVSIAIDCYPGIQVRTSARLVIKTLTEEKVFYKPWSNKTVYACAMWSPEVTAQMKEPLTSEGAIIGRN